MKVQVKIEHLRKLNQFDDCRKVLELAVKEAFDGYGCFPEVESVDIVWWGTPNRECVIWVTLGNFYYPPNCFVWCFMSPDLLQPSISRVDPTTPIQNDRDKGFIPQPFDFTIVPESSKHLSLIHI